jgi:SAM-dependent methyltransferase
MLTAIILACMPRSFVTSLKDWTDLEPHFVLGELEDPLRIGGILENPSACRPNQVLDVGCGRGELVAAFNNLAVPVLGIDPSAAALDYTEETLANPRWCDTRAATTRLQALDLDAIEKAEVQAPIDCLVFLESIEHIERAVVRDFFTRVLAIRHPLIAARCRITIANIWFPVWDYPDHLWGVGKAPCSGEENRRLGRGYWWREYDELCKRGQLTELFRSPTNPTVVFETQ